MPQTKKSSKKASTTRERIIARIARRNRKLNSRAEMLKTLKLAYKFALDQVATRSRMDAVVRGQEPVATIGRLTRAQETDLGRRLASYATMS